MLKQGVDVETTTRKKRDYQHIPFHANIKKYCKYQFKKETALHITPRVAVKTVLFRLKKKQRLS